MTLNHFPGGPDTVVNTVTDMNNSSLMSADGATHLKIVVVSLVAAIVVVCVGIAARPDVPNGASAGSLRIEASGPVIKAGKPVVWTSRETTIR